VLAEGFLKVGDMEDVVYFSSLWKLQLVSYDPYLPVDLCRAQRNMVVVYLLHSFLWKLSCMVGALGRPSHQPQKYDQLCACVLGPYVGSVR
jgi:hypothetical protein